MRIIRQRRILGTLVLAALLLVPVLASGHHHAGSTAPCAACAVTRHSPVLTAASVSVATLVQLAVVVEPLAPTAPVAPSVGHATSRGPPALLLSREA